MNLFLPCYCLAFQFICVVLVIEFQPDALSFGHLSVVSVFFAGTCIDGFFDGFCKEGFNVDRVDVVLFVANGFREGCDGFDVVIRVDDGFSEEDFDGLVEVVGVDVDGINEVGFAVKCCDVVIRVGVFVVVMGALVTEPSREEFAFGPAEGYVIGLPEGNVLVSTEGIAEGE